MLRLIIGKAGSGKTSRIMGEIAQRVHAELGPSMLIIPEQYSHEAERELCRVCGDTMSRYADVYSFTGLARRLMAEKGGSAKPYLDKGGRMLCMARALDLIAPRLRVYSSTRKRAKVQAILLQEIDELKAACVSPEELRTAAEHTQCDPVLRGKLRDISLVLETYDAVVENGHADPTEQLTLLANLIPNSSIGQQTRIYVDGFSDFSAQELRVVKALIDTGAQVTVCLTLDRLYSDNEIFSIPSRTASQLMSYAKEKGIGCSAEVTEDKEKNSGISFFTDHMFSYSDLHYEGTDRPIRLCCTETMTEECEYAAAYCLKLVRDEGCRWRDIAIAVRGFGDYKELLESCFEHYGVPLFTANRTELAAKPLPSLIAGLYELVEDGWAVDEFISYLHTGLTGLSNEESDLLENYVYLWQLRGTAWKRESDWHQHPDGYSADYSDEINEKLKKINELRRKVADPILKFESSSRNAVTAKDHAAALAEYFSDLRLPEILHARAENLSRQNRKELAAEYVQLWDVVCSAVEQCAAILGNTEMNMTEFGQLYLTVLSQYDVGTIPISLDSVTAGDFDRMRRRNIRHMIVLGATDSRIPRASENRGVFSEEDRIQLKMLEVQLSGGGEEDLWREFNLIYNTMTLPSETILFTRPSVNADGAEENFSLICRRAKAIFRLTEEYADMKDCRLSAPMPALGVAATGMYGTDRYSAAAAEFFRQEQPNKFREICEASVMERGTLSPKVAEQLYGKKLRLSASKIDILASCKFEYFCRYGLEAQKHEPIGFQPPEIGTFFHSVLENVAKEVKGQGGWKNVTDRQLEKITDHWIDAYVQNEMDGLKEKSPRFIYLFHRLRDEVLQIVLDMGEELRKSDFEPIEFEFNFAKEKDIHPIELGNGMGAMTLTGIADRIDGWKCGDTLYIRVVDYKTGTKKFRLSDIWYGTGLQMLLYLYSLEQNTERFGVKHIVPAGVMYVAAKSKVQAEKMNVSDEVLQKELRAELKRSGIVLYDEKVFEAWENGEDKIFIPVRFKKTADPDNTATSRQFGMMYRHIVKLLSEMAVELHSGNITAAPLCKSEVHRACDKCDYEQICRFRNGENGETMRIKNDYSDAEVWKLMEGEIENGEI